MNQLNVKLIKWSVIGILSIVALMFLNPMDFNDASERTVVTKQNGKQFVRFTPGLYFAGFFAKTTKWPNQISISSTEDKSVYSLEDNTIEIGLIKDVRFNDATTAIVAGITQYILPSSSEQMLAIHNAHKRPEAFVQRRLAPYTIECLKSSAQLLSSL